MQDVANTITERRNVELHVEKKLILEELSEDVGNKIIVNLEGNEMTAAG